MLLPRLLAHPLRGIALLVLAAGLLTGCGKEAPDRPGQDTGNDMALDVDTTLTDTTYTLLNQDSATVAFPDDVLGRPVVLGTIYTSCPNICPQITANMNEVRAALDSSVQAQFVSLTFDPQRDTPSRLAKYQKRFNLTGTSWQFLTGDPATLDRLLDRLGVRRRVKGTDREFARPDTSNYVFTHSNQITLIDAQGRVRAEYGGSQTPASLIARDVEKIQP